MRRMHGYTLGSQSAKCFERGDDNDPVKKSKEKSFLCVPLCTGKEKLKIPKKQKFACMHSLTLREKILLETVWVFTYQDKNWEDAS